MLRRNTEMEHEWKQGIWGGKGTLDVCKVFTPEELGGRASCFNVVTLQPGIPLAPTAILLTPRYTTFWQES